MNDADRAAWLYALWLDLEAHRLRIQIVQNLVLHDIQKLSA